MLHKGSECAQRLQFKGRGDYEVNETRYGGERLVVELENGKELMAVEKGSAATWGKLDNSRPRLPRLYREGHVRLIRRRICFMVGKPQAISL